jgi:hypothetical protein
MAFGEVVADCDGDGSPRDFTPPCRSHPITLSGNGNKYVIRAKAVVYNRSNELIDTFSCSLEDFFLNTSQQLDIVTATVPAAPANGASTSSQTISLLGPFTISDALTHTIQIVCRQQVGEQTSLARSVLEAQLLGSLQLQ